LLRENHSKKDSAKNNISIEEARKNKLKLDWNKIEITVPNFLGIKILENYPLEEIKEYIDWTPFFIAWEFKGKYPKIFENEKIGKEAKKLFDEAQKLLDEIISGNLLKANAVLGTFPANSVKDDIELYSDDERNNKLATLHTLRQQTSKSNKFSNLALSDFIAPKETNKKDYIGAFAVTTGIGVKELVDKYEKDNDDYNAIMVKAIADRLVEAFAELLHKKSRTEIWGYAKEENLANDDLIKEKYIGIRPAPGYPAQPDHTEKKTLFEILDVEKNIKISLTESFAMYPTASVSGFYFANPNSKYFNIGKISKDQVEDYAKRKNMNLEEMEKWLAPVLNYK
jgi:5-methyltetrahydrofolate--homocysteine methyltransferase